MLLTLISDFFPKFANHSVNRQKDKRISRHFAPSAERRPSTARQKKIKIETFSRLKMEEYIVSARKYRPMTFDSVVGQIALTTTLKNAVKNGKLAHAYLFCGPRGVGKTTCARIFAKAINCEHPNQDGEACNECESCKAFNDNRSYNIFELDAASNNSVENIKQLMEQTRIPPQVGKYKVFIIDEVHMLSSQAFNAFLKTLEEPPSHVIFILATTEKHKILPTILSRCQIYDFERMSVPNTIAHLKMVAEKEGIKYEEQALAVIAEKADGGMRDALSIFDQVASFCQGDITYAKVIEDLNVLDSDNYFKLIDLALENKVMEMMLLLNGILAKGFDGGNMIQGLAQHIRNVMMAKDTQTLSLIETSDNQRAKYAEQAKKAPTSFLYNALKLTNTCDVQYRQSSNKRLLVELTLIEIGQITQPEDKDVPGAGRTPHRLKSLFQKLMTQPKPAAQGAGAGSQTVGSIVSKPTGQTVSILQGDSKVSPQKETTKVPTTKATMANIQLGKIGMTFSNLKKSEEAMRQRQNPTADVQAIGTANNDTHNDLFDEDALQHQWTGMCIRMQQANKNFLGLSQRMMAIRPQLLEWPNIEVVADNQLLLDNMLAIKNRIRNTLVLALNNSAININYRLAERQEIRKVLNKQELLQNMRKENAALDKLCTKLKLVMA